MTVHVADGNRKIAWKSAFDCWMIALIGPSHFYFKRKMPAEIEKLEEFPLLCSVFFIANFPISYVTLRF